MFQSCYGFRYGVLNYYCNVSHGADFDLAPLKIENLVSIFYAFL
jgi:hypothetical protein